MVPIEWVKEAIFFSRQNGKIKGQNLEIPPKRISEGKRVSLDNSQFSGNFCFYETKLLISEKLVDFCLTLSVVISYCQSEVTVF